MGHSIIENKIYASIIGQCEEIESNGQYRGNGHHLAQKITTMVSIAILSKQQSIIFNALTKEPQTTREISEKVNIPTKNVSSQLKQMHKSTLLVHCIDKNERRKLWYR